MIVFGGLLLVVFVSLAVSRRRSKQKLSIATLRAIRKVSSPSRCDWVDAMLAEHDAIGDRRSARRFARGCLRALLFSPSAADVTARTIGGALGAAVACAVGLALYGIVVYPDIRPDGGTWWVWSLYLAVFLAVLAFFSVVGLSLASLGSARVRRVGVLAGASAALLGWWAAQSDAVVSSVSLIVVALPLVVVVMVVARRTGRRDQAAVAAGLMAITAGLLIFIADVTTIYVTGGGPPTPFLLHQFAHSGAHSYAGWAINEALGGAVVLLCCVPVVIVVLGLLATQIVAAKGLSTPGLTENSPESA